MIHATTCTMRHLRTAAVLLTIIFGLTACDNGGSGQSAAAITAQPTDQSVVTGTTASFTVVATDATGYQWQSSTDSGATFVDVSGATAASYSTAVTTLGDSGTQYRVVVSGASNNVTSSAVTLTVTSVANAPAITVQPAPAAVTAPAIANFSVTATGTNLNYQWQQCQDSIETCASWSDLSGATAATYATGATDVSMTGQRFRVIVSNTEGSLDSAVVSLNVDPTPVAPVITSQPVDAAVVAPATASFTVAFTSVPTVMPLWQYSNDGINWFNLGVLDNTYTTAATSIGDNGRQFRAILENTAGSVTTNVVTLTVTAAASVPSFTTQPANVTVTEEQNAQFTVVVAGIPTPTLQWQLSTDNGSNWSNITNETGATYTAVAPAQANSGRQFRCVASNSEGAVNSNAATLTVTAASPVTITSSSPLPAGIVNTAYSVTLTASGGTPPFTWSVADGYTLPSFLTLNASTGEISGTPTAEASYGWAIQVRDSANPQQTSQKSFDLSIEAVCDIGLGSTTVAGAPNTVGGKFCPQTNTPPGSPNGYGNVYVYWGETTPGVSEGLLVMFNLATGQLVEISFSLNDPQRSWTYICTANGTVDYPACGGVTLNTTNGTVTFLNTTVGSGTSPVFTLNGMLTY